MNKNRKNEQLENLSQEKYTLEATAIVRKARRYLRSQAQSRKPKC